MLFAKFENVEIASKALSEMTKKVNKFNDNELWCKPDAPVEVRVVRSVLLGLRWQLGEWGFSKKSIKVDVPASTFKVDGKIIVTLETNNDKINLIWNDDGWKQWQELHESKEMMKLMREGNDKLKQAAENRGKGIGKGKGKPE